MKNGQIIEEAVKRARDHARNNGIEIGKVVGHPSDTFSYELVEKIRKDNIAVVSRPVKKASRGNEVRKKFPLDEIFDVNVAMQLAFEVRDEEVAKRFPGGIIARFD